MTFHHALPLMCPLFMVSDMHKSILHGAGKLTPLLFIASKCFKGCILVFEYYYFLLQNKTVNAFKLAVKKYQQSGTQAAVLKALRKAIKEHSTDHQALQDSIFDIIIANRMCKLFL